MNLATLDGEVRAASRDARGQGLADTGADSNLKADQGRVTPMTMRRALTFAGAQRIIRAEELPPPGPLHEPSVCVDVERARGFPPPGGALAR